MKLRGGNVNHREVQRLQGMWMEYTFPPEACCDSFSSFHFSALLTSVCSFFSHTSHQLCKSPNISWVSHKPTQFRVGTCPEVRAQLPFPMPVPMPCASSQLVETVGCYDPSHRVSDLLEEFTELRTAVYSVLLAH